MDTLSVRTSTSCSTYTSGFLNQLQSEWNEFILEISHSTPHDRPNCDTSESNKKCGSKAAFIESLNRFNRSTGGNIFIPVPLNTLRKLFSPSKHNVDDIFKKDFFREIGENLNLTKLSCKRLQQLLSIDESTNEISDFPSPSLPKNFRNSAPPNLFPIKKSKTKQIKADIVKTINRITEEKDENLSRKINPVFFEKCNLFNDKENFTSAEVKNKGVDIVNNHVAEIRINLNVEKNVGHERFEIVDTAKKSTDKKSAVPYENIFNQQNNYGSSSDSSTLFYTFKHPRRLSKPTVVCTYFNQKDLSEIYRIVKKLGFFEIENHVSSRTTHLICGGTNKTINLCKAIARGCWILNKDWVTNSNEANRWLLEERFEKKSLSPAVQENRRKRQKSGSMYQYDVFSNCGSMYVSTGCMQPSAEDLKELISLGGGRLEEFPERASYIIGCQSERRYVKEIWILNCVLRGHLIDVDKYIRNKS